MLTEEMLSGQDEAPLPDMGDDILEVPSLRMQLSAQPDVAYVSNHNYAGHDSAQHTTSIPEIQKTPYAVTSSMLRQLPGSKLQITYFIV